MDAQREGLAFRYAQWHSVGSKPGCETELQPLLDSLGIKRAGLHAFRHANLTFMDRLGVPVKVRMQRVGHSDSALTLGTYTHIASEDDLRFAGQLGRILRPNAPKKENGSGVEPPKPFVVN